MDKASPQLENGYIKIANEIIDALVGYRLAGEQMQCLLFVLRKTYGFNKKSDAISIVQFCQTTGMKRENVYRAISSLVAKKILKCSNNDTKGSKVYEFNKNYNQWSACIKKDTVAKKIQPCINNATNSVSIMLPATLIKDTSTKDTIKDKELYVEIIQYLNKKTKKHFKSTNRKTQSLINSRIKEGFTEQDFLTVIDNKHAKWFTDPKMCEYLRPETLFGTKFESYLNDVPHPLQGKVSIRTIKNIQNMDDWERSG